MHRVEAISALYKTVKKKTTQNRRCIDNLSVAPLLIFSAFFVHAQLGRYLHGECLEMVDRLKPLRGEVLNEVLTAQIG